MADYSDYLQNPELQYKPGSGIPSAAPPAGKSPPPDSGYDKYIRDKDAPYDPGISLPGRTRLGGESVHEDAAKGIVESFARGAGSGITANADDELAGALALHSRADLLNSYMQAKSLGLLDKEGEKQMAQLQEDWQDPIKKVYEPARDAVRAANKQSYEDAPGAFVLGNVAGGAALPVGGAAAPASIGVRTMRGAGLGAFYGGLSGFNSGEDTQDRLERGATGAVTGAALGGPGAAVFGKGPVHPGVASSSRDVIAAQDRLGIDPVPIGVAADSPAMHGVTGAARQLPIVGGMIDTQLGKTVSSMEQKVGDEAAGLAVGAGSATDRTSIGNSARASMNKFIEDQDQRANDAFAAMRTYVGGGDNPYPIAGDSQLIRTLENIRRQRVAAGADGIPMSDLTNVLNLATHPEGATFNGLQRARSDLDKLINWNNRNGGFNQGDLKQARDAMTDAMRENIRQAVSPAMRTTALGHFDAMNSLYGELTEHTNDLREFMRSASDEQMVDRIIGYGSSKTGQGNMGMLLDIKASLPTKDWKNITGYALQKMGQNNKGEFSPPMFLNRWASLQDGAKEAMYGPAGTGTRQFIDDIATVSTRLQEGSKYANKSETGRAVLTGGALLAAFGIGEFNPVEHVRLMAGGYGFAYMLSRPATARSMANWSKAYFALVKAPSDITKRAFGAASRQFATQIGEVYGVRDKVDGIAQYLQPSPQESTGFGGEEEK